MDGTQVGVAQAHDIASGGLFNSSTAQTGAPGGSLGQWENRQKLNMPTRQNLEQTSFTVDYAITDNLALKYLYGSTDVLDANGQDYGGAEFNFFLDYNVGRTELDSHELQFSGDHGRVHWSAGAYTWDQKSRNRGTDYAGADWLHTPDRGIEKFLDYDDVLASPACQMTAADRGLDFEGVVRGNGTVVGPADSANSWITPCNDVFGHGIIDVMTIFLTSGDEGREDSQDGDAFFGELTFDITDRLDVTVGARRHEQTNSSFLVDYVGGIAAGITEAAPYRAGGEYASYDRALSGNLVATGPGSLQDPTATTSFKNTSYRFGVSFDVSDDVMVFLGYNEGFNSGGTSSFFDTAGNLVANNFNPEIIENTEIGIRADLLGGSMRLNATVFSTDWVGIQIQAQAIDPITGNVLTAVTTQNAASGKAEGIDIELTYLPTENLMLGANLGFLDTGYTAVESGLTEAYDLNTTFTGAPDETYNFSVQYTWGLGNGGSLMARTNYSYTGFFERSSLLSFRQRSILPNRDPEGGDFWMLDMRAVYTPAQGNYEISLYGNNLTDEYNLNSGFLHRFWNFDFGTVDNSREVGLGFRINF
jgi:outer membrane receptor protein involved in Fe transport